MAAQERRAQVVAVLAQVHPEYARKSQSALRAAVQEALASRPKAAEAPSPSKHKLDEQHDEPGRRPSPRERWSNVAGVDEAVEALDEALVAPYRHAQAYASVGARGPRGVLVHGPSGSGKTLACRAAAGEAVAAAAARGIEAAYFEVRDARREADRVVRETMEAARSAAPALVFFDDVDKWAEKGLWAALAEELDEPGEVRVCCAVASADAVEGRLRRFGRLEREVALGAPDRRGREAVLRHHLDRLPEVAADPRQAALDTPGWLGADLAALVADAAAGCARRGGRAVETSDLEAASKRVRPAFVRAGGFAASPGVAWADVGALVEARDELAASILRPIADPEAFEALGVPLPAGVLLFGPPGCGKTLLAKALATESAANFVAVKGPELLDKYVGESERAVRSVFSRARASPPCIVFFDEIDALCPRRASGGPDSSSAVADRVVNQLLTELDGLDARGRLYVVAATNRPELLDPALLRPGRLDKRLFVPLPSAADRASILNALTRRVKLASDVDLVALANDPRATGFSGADLAALVRQAGLGALADGKQPRLRDADFQTALDRIPPSVSPAQAQAYADLAHRMRNARPRVAGATTNKRPRTPSSSSLADEPGNS